MNMAPIISGLIPPNLLPHRWRTRREAGLHNEAVIGVLDTPPIVPRRDGLVIFSMIGTAVLLPYLVAVKSLWGQLQRGRVVILDDGTLTAADRTILAQHCGDPEIIAIADVKTDPFPTGGTWERLLTILDRRASEYGIQLDSDTVTVGPVPEVADAISRNRSFCLLGGSDAEISALPLGDFARALYPDGPQDGHVQTRVESRMATLANPQGWRYLRGCSGFTGFAAGGPGRDLAAAFLTEMETLLGRKDTFIWGTEQIASNFHLANEPGVVPLPYARYLNYWNEAWPENAGFVHFVGTHRHDNGAYKAASLAAIAAMKA